MKTIKTRTWPKKLAYRSTTQKKDYKNKNMKQDKNNKQPDRLRTTTIQRWIRPPLMKKVVKLGNKSIHNQQVCVAPTPLKKGVYVSVSVLDTCTDTCGYV